MNKTIIYILSALTLILAPSSLFAQDVIKQKIEEKLHEGDCDKAEQFYKAWKKTDMAIEQQIAECKKAQFDKNDTECQFINVGTFEIRLTTVGNEYKEPSHKEIIDSLRKQHPQIDKYYYLGVKNRKGGLNSHKEGLVQSFHNYEIIAPDYRANMKNALERMIPNIPKSSAIYIDSINTPSTNDYMTEKDFRDEMTSLLLKAGYRVLSKQSIQSGIDYDYIMNISTRDNALKLTAADRKTREYICMDIVQFNNMYARPMGLILEINCIKSYKHVR